MNILNRTALVRLLSIVSILFFFEGGGIHAYMPISISMFSKLAPIILCLLFLLKYQLALVNFDNHKYHIVLVIFIFIFMSLSLSRPQFGYVGLFFYLICISYLRKPEMAFILNLYIYMVSILAALVVIQAFFLSISSEVTGDPHFYWFDINSNETFYDRYERTGILGSLGHAFELPSRILGLKVYRVYSFLAEPSVALSVFGVGSVVALVMNKRELFILIALAGLLSLSGAFFIFVIFGFLLLFLSALTICDQHTIFRQICCLVIIGFVLSSILLDHSLIIDYELYKNRIIPSSIESDVYRILRISSAWSLLADVVVGDVKGYGFPYGFVASGLVYGGIVLWAGFLALIISFSRCIVSCGGLSKVAGCFLYSLLMVVFFLSDYGFLAPRGLGILFLVFGYLHASRSDV